MAYYARYGIKCVGYDIVPETARIINDGKITVPGLGQWLGFSIEPLVKNGLMHATTDVKEIIEDPTAKVHFVWIPTRRNGKPWAGAFQDDAKKIPGTRDHNVPDHG